MTCALVFFVSLLFVGTFCQDLCQFHLLQLPQDFCQSRGHLQLLKPVKDVDTQTSLMCEMQGVAKQGPPQGPDFSLG